jgi:glycosyltransferase involved in cell wall biosynthesis
VTRLILFAPNVNTGGGLVLLQALLSDPQLPPGPMFLDARAADRLVLPQGSDVRWVRPRVSDRFGAERALANTARAEDLVVCFHGLPPIFRSAARVVVFLQNRLYLSQNPLSDYPWRTATRIAIERTISRVFRHRVSRYVVQTPSMRRALLAWHGGQPVVSVCPAVDKQIAALRPSHETPAVVRDFIYVADGVGHKNHARLLDAWRLLAAEGLRPSLALTLGERDQALVKVVEEAALRDGLNITNLGQIGRESTFEAYRSSRAMVFPSTAESFGLPLIEASRLGLPIVASELDFVRDVCDPVQTFDPNSAVSIARAVRRFLGDKEQGLTFLTTADFVRELLA